ncbi:MAG: hypothetical protein AAFW46_07580 [Pseudomonadota bacterium]
MTGAARWIGLTLSGLAHGALVLAVAFQIDLFGREEPPEIEFVEAQILSAEEFAELTAAAEPEPTEQLASVEQPAPPAPEPPQPPDAPAPYETEPAAPNPLVFDPESTSDAPVEDQIREALPKPRVAQPDVAPTPPPNQDAAPQVETASDEAPPAEETPEPDANKPQIANAPPQPEPNTRDRAPQPDQPDTPPERTAEAAPEPEPDPHPHAPEAVAADELPKRRPTRVAEAAAPEPEAPEPAAPSPPTPPATRTAERSQAPVVGPKLSLSERNGLRISLTRCWSRPDAAGVDPRLLVVKIRMQLREDGRIIGRPRIIEPQRLTVTRQRAAVIAAQRALSSCQPYQLPPAKYASWREIIVTFDPREEAAGVQ